MRWFAFSALLDLRPSSTFVPLSTTQLNSVSSWIFAVRLLLLPSPESSSSPDSLRTTRLLSGRPAEA